MSQFLDAAYRTLITEGRPLSASEITALATSRNLLASSGKTPHQTMKSKLATDILRYKERSAFMRVDKATFALRDWKTTKLLEEYTADRYQKALLDEHIMAFPQSILRDFVPGRGFFRQGNSDLQDLFAQCHEVQRRLAEEDLSIVQLVSVFVVHFGDEILTYKRSRRLPESRLHGTYSLVFGGHVNADDLPSLFGSLEPGKSSQYFLRELREELRFEKAGSRVTYEGLLYDDERDLSRQHLGIVFDVRLGSREFAIGERGFLIDPRLERPQDIELRLSDFENWSQLLLRQLVPDLVKRT